VPESIQSDFDQYETKRIKKVNDISTSTQETLQPKLLDDTEVTYLISKLKNTLDQGNLEDLHQ
jgi:hypothetical protein